MITIDNFYQRLLAYHSTPDWPEASKLDNFLRPSLELQVYAFRDGSVIQLLACLSDLRNWAMQNRFLGEEGLAWTLFQVAADWEKELQLAAKVEREEQEQCTPQKSRKL
jgi:hypothetical protein